MNKTTQALEKYLFSEREAEVYVILDGASVQDLLDRLYEDKPEYECLYRGELKPDLAEVAPYLVRLEYKNKFCDWVLQQGWGQHWGIFVVSYADLRVLRRHFRTFLMVHDATGKPMYFRYYDPRVLRVYLPSCNAEELGIMFGPVASYLLEDQNPNTLIRFQSAGGQLMTQKQELNKEN